MSDINQEKIIEEQPIPIPIERTKKNMISNGKFIYKIYLENGNR